MARASGLAEKTANRPVTDRGLGIGVAHRAPLLFRESGQPLPFRIYQRAQIWSGDGVAQGLLCGGSSLGVFLKPILSEGEMVPIVRVGLSLTQSRGNFQIVFRALIVSVLELHDPQSGAGERRQGCLVRFYRR